MNKRVLTILLAACMCLTGCGGKNADISSSDVSTDSEISSSVSAGKELPGKELPQKHTSENTEISASQQTSSEPQQSEPVTGIWNCAYEETTDTLYIGGDGKAYYDVRNSQDNGLKALYYGSWTEENGKFTLNMELSAGNPLTGKNGEFDRIYGDYVLSENTDHNLMIIPEKNAEPLLREGAVFSPVQKEISFNTDSIQDLIDDKTAYVSDEILKAYPHFEMIDIMDNGMLTRFYNENISVWYVINPETKQVWDYTTGKELHRENADASMPFTEKEEVMACQAAMAYYTAHNDHTPGHAVIDSSDEYGVTIHLYDDMGTHTATCAWYKINPRTMKGTDEVTFEEIDFSQTSQETQPEDPTERACEAALNYFAGMFCYRPEFAECESETEDGLMIIIYDIIDGEKYVQQKYVINPETLTGYEPYTLEEIDFNGSKVFADMTPRPFTPMEERCMNIVLEYYKKYNSDSEPDVVSIEDWEDGEYIIHLYNDMPENTASLAWYSINPNTLEGSDYITGEKINFTITVPVFGVEKEELAYYVQGAAGTYHREHNKPSYDYTEVYSGYTLGLLVQFYNMEGNEKKVVDEYIINPHTLYGYDVKTFEWIDFSDYAYHEPVFPAEATEESLKTVKRLCETSLDFYEKMYGIRPEHSNVQFINHKGMLVQLFNESDNGIETVAWYLYTDEQALTGMDYMTDMVMNFKPR